MFRPLRNSFESWMFLYNFTFILSICVYFMSFMLDIFSDLLCLFLFCLWLLDSVVRETRIFWFELNVSVTYPRCYTATAFILKIKRTKKPLPNRKGNHASIMAIIFHSVKKVLFFFLLLIYRFISKERENQALYGDIKIFSNICMWHSLSGADVFKSIVKICKGGLE